MATSSKCKNPKCKKNGDPAYDGYCGPRHQTEANAPVLSQADISQRFAVAMAPIPTPKAIASNTGGPACPAPGSNNSSSTSGMTPAQRDSHLAMLRIAAQSGNMDPKLRANQIAAQQGMHTFSRNPDSWIFPETAIFSISTHGSIILNEGVPLTSAACLPMFDFNTFSPKLRNMWKFNAVAPGVSNIMPSFGPDAVFRATKGYFKQADITQIIDAVEEAYNDNKDKPFNKIKDQVMEMVEFATQFQSETTWEEEKKSLAEMKAERIKAGRAYPNDDDDGNELTTQAYVDMFMDGRKSINCLAGGPMINKTYIMQKKDVTVGEDWGIFCINSLRPDDVKQRDGHNLFDMINQVYNKGATDADGDRFIKLSDIIKFVTEHGAKDVIIIDVTCSPYQDKNLQSVTPRQARKLTQDFLPRTRERRYGGRNSKRRNSKRRRSSRRRSSRRRN